MATCNPLNWRLPCVFIPLWSPLSPPDSVPFDLLGTYPLRLLNGLVLLVHPPNLSLPSNPSFIPGIHTRPAMRSRHGRNPAQPHTLSPHTLSPLTTTSTTAFPRASSPSGLSHLLSKPAKWFSRNASPRAPSAVPSEPRSSTSSFVRKPKISHPTDPRPILPSLQSEPYIQSSTHVASRSVPLYHYGNAVMITTPLFSLLGPYLTSPLRVHKVK